MPHHWLWQKCQVRNSSDNEN